MLKRMPAYRLAQIGLLFTLCSSLTPSSSELTAVESLQDRIDRLVQPYLDNSIVVGMTIGVRHQGESHAFGYGRLSSQDARVPDGQTIYEIGSITKVFTGVLLADAVARGSVRLDQAAATLLPEGVSMPALGDQPISLQDLSTHVSGLPRLPSNLVPADPQNPYAAYTIDDLYFFLNQHKLTRAPGIKMEYSNLAQGLLGHLLALHENKTYQELVRQKIALPLELRDTTISLDQEQRARLAPPHLPGGQAAKNWDLPAIAGAGALRSTVNDLLRFATASLSPPVGEVGAALDLAWQVHQEPVAESDFAMGLGWHIARDGTTRWHNGQTGGYHSMMLINRHLQSAVVVLGNTATGEIDRLAEDLIRMLAGASVEPRTFEAAIEVAPDVMQRYVGKYSLLPGLVFTVSVDDDKLMIGLTGQPTLQVFARSETEWFSPAVPATITFEVDETGRCSALELRQDGRRQKAERIE